MFFNTHLFIFLFMPISILLYFLFNKLDSKFGKIFLLIGSFIFYIPAGKVALLTLFLSCVVNLIISKLIISSKNKKAFLTIGIILNVMFLFFVKYMNFFIENINHFFALEINTFKLILPLGISFITFQQIMYIVETYRQNEKISSTFDYFLYAFYFPKIVMGPLVEPADLISKFNNKTLKKVNLDNIASGFALFSFGLFKKVVLADTFVKAVSWGFLNLTDASSIDLIIVALSYTFQIYFDFSGYSDMSRGVSRMLNIELPINFDSPYKSISIVDFWKRWHISLTKFMTKYIYFPLGGSRKGKFKTYRNIIIVFLVSGFWHGANWTYILWGLLNGLLSVSNRVFSKTGEKIHSGIKWLANFIVINVLWLLFRANSIKEWAYMLKKIFMDFNFNTSTELLNNFKLVEFNFIFRVLHVYRFSETIPYFNMAVIFISSFIICLALKNNNHRKNATLFNSIIVSIAFVWGVLSLTSESHFIYNNF